MTRNFHRDRRKSVRNAARQAASLVIAVAASLFVQGCASLASRVPLHVYQDEQTIVSLWEGECEGKVAARITQSAPAQYRDRFRNLTSTFTLRNGARQDFAGCWMELTDAEMRGQGGAFYLLFEDGDQHVVPKARFTARGAGAI